jgi:branched-chain amino acid transport system substrate-binding protein
MVGTDTYSNSHTIASLLTKSGLDTSFFISVDYALGHALVKFSKPSHC